MFTQWLKESASESRPGMVLSMFMVLVLLQLSFYLAHVFASYVEASNGLATMPMSNELTLQLSSSY